MYEKSKYFSELISILKTKVFPEKKINHIKLKLCKAHKIVEIPTNIQILLHADKKDVKKLDYLQAKPTRTISGVSVIALMTKPLPCPQQAKCIYCPGGPGSILGDVPKSYTGKEPSTMRGKRNMYDPYLETFNRLEQYVVLGHNFDKVELIAMGGTFTNFPKSYQKEFITYAFKALNDFSKMFFDFKGRFNIMKFKKFFELPGEVGDPERTRRIQEKLLKVKREQTTSLEKEQKKNEKSFVRCVGLTIETRPDCAALADGNEMLRLGATRVELGIQTVYDDILKKIMRGHTAKDGITATRTMKDLGFKVNYHVMPGLPGVNYKKDLEGLKKLFSDESYRPDMLKIYPCMVMKGTELYGLWKKGIFKPLTTEKAAELIAEFKKCIPPYCRVMRVQRDIPTYMTEAGVDRTNLRQYIEWIMQKNKWRCRCIRCREIGHVYKKCGKVPKNVELTVREYNASKGREFFISFEDKKQDILLGFARLRFPSESLRKEITKDSVLLRELHIYGQSIRIGKKIKEQWGIAQHMGLGGRLLKKAEEIAKQNNKKKVVVISGVGAREYYRKFGYKREGPYMVKKLY